MEFWSHVESVLAELDSKQTPMVSSTQTADPLEEDPRDEPFARNYLPANVVGRFSFPPPTEVFHWTKGISSLIGRYQALSISSSDARYGMPCAGGVAED